MAPVAVAFEDFMRSLVAVGGGEAVRLVGCADVMLAPAGLDDWSRCFSYLPTAV
jgi:hypothetical protein